MTERVKIQRSDWPHHRAELLAVRFAVFVEEQGVPAEIEEDDQDPAATHLLARDAHGTAVGCGRLLPGGVIGRMAVLADHRGHGIGGRLLQELLAIAAGAGLSRLTLHAQCSAQGFYHRAGFRPVGPVFEEAGIPHQKMVRDLEQG